MSSQVPTSTPSRRRVTPPPAHAAAWTSRLADVEQVRATAWLDVAPGDRVLAVVAHPDDETLAMGGTLAALALEGVETHVLSLSCGEAALDHVGVQVPGLAERRRRELAEATAALGVLTAEALGWPDSALEQHGDAVAAAVADRLGHLRPAAVLTLWRDDPHPDHRAASRAARRAVKRYDGGEVPVGELALWTLHWTPPEEVTAPVRLVAPSPAAAAAKGRALAAYTSQTRPLADDVEAVLPAAVVAWPHEVVVGR